jgi:hypothetical protein
VVSVGYKDVPVLLRVLAYGRNRKGTVSRYAGTFVQRYLDEFNNNVPFLTMNSHNT